MPSIRPTAADPAEWPQRPVVLPAGWNAIEVERLWIRDEPMALVAAHGEVARLGMEARA